MNSSMSKVPAIFGLLTLIFVTQPSFSASVKSIGRSVSVESNGQVMQQRTISCGDQKLRVIIKRERSRQWCFGAVEQCFRDKLMAAKKACKAPSAETKNVAAELPFKKAVENEQVSKPEPALAVEPISASETSIASEANGGLNDAQRQELLSELRDINSARQKIRVKLQQIDSKIADIRGGEKAP